MSQRTVERVVGRLITDEEFRLEFTRRPAQILAALVEQGWELTAIEVDALVQTDTRLWSDGARRINPRLQRSSLKTSEENIRSSSWPLLGQKAHHGARCQTTDEHDPRAQRHTPEQERRIREAALDETIEASFPAFREPTVWCQLIAGNVLREASKPR
jgi:hypothetical protein